MTKTCVHCGKELFGVQSHTKFCCSKCQRDYNRRPCVVCGKVKIIHSQGMCQTCKRKRDGRTYGDTLAPMSRCLQNIERIVARNLVDPTCPTDAFAEPWHTQELRGMRVG